MVTLELPFRLVPKGNFAWLTDLPLRVYACSVGQVTPIQGPRQKPAIPKRASLIRLEPVLNIVQTAIYTGRLANDSPVSLCLVAESQSAKSQCLIYYSETKSLKLFSDITAKGLTNEVRAIESNQLRHIVLLDLHMIVSHNRYTTDRALLTLGALMEEGIGSVSDAGGIVSFDGLPKIGVLMAVTPDFWIQKRGHWRKTGFLTRFITVRYEYTEATQNRIHTAVRDGVILPDPKSITLPDKPISVEIQPKHADIIMSQAQQWALLNDDQGFRYHKQLRRMLKACSLIDNRDLTNSADIDRLMSIIKFMNPQEPVAL